MQLNNQEKSLISLHITLVVNFNGSFGSSGFLWYLISYLFYVLFSFQRTSLKDYGKIWQFSYLLSTDLVTYISTYLCQFTNNFLKISEPPLCQYWALTSTISHLQGSVSQMTRHNNDFIRYLKLSHLEIVLKRTWLQSWDVWWQQSLETWESLSQHTEN